MIIKFRKINGLFLTLMLMLMSSSCYAASYQFSWVGSDGYRLEGAFSIPGSLAQAKHIDERAVKCFWIAGYRSDNPVGQWNISQLTDETNWRLNFEPQSSRFRTGGHSQSQFGQEWNMNGFGIGCGEGGFGFNSGNATQDICINNLWIKSSIISPKTSLLAIRNDQIVFEAADCNLLEIS